MRDLASADLAPCPVVAVLLVPTSLLDELDLTAGEAGAGDRASEPVSPPIIAVYLQRAGERTHCMRREGSERQFEVKQGAARAAHLPVVAGRQRHVHHLRYTYLQQKEPDLSLMSIPTCPWVWVRPDYRVKRHRRRSSHYYRIRNMLVLTLILIACR